MIRRLLASSLLAAAVLAGCHSGQRASTQASAGQDFKVYKLRGKVASINAARGELTVNGEAIPGYMEAMTMSYKVKDATILSGLQPGETITADLLVSANTDADMLLDHIAVLTQAKP